MHAYLLRRAVGLHEARRGAGVRRAAARRRRRPRRSATPAWPSRGEHPDVHEVERAGPAISAEQAREIVHVTSLAPVEGERKVVVLHDFHLLTAEAAARLLKSIEEPPPSTTFLVLADFVPPELVTIASRCVRIDFRSIPDDVLAARLLPRGSPDDAVDAIVAAAGGDLTRARILATDPASSSAGAAFAARADAPRRHRRRRWWRRSTTCWRRIEAAAAPLAARQAAEMAELEARIERFGERGSGRKALEERHKRELRRHRTDELRSGLGVLAGAYRDLLVGGAAQHPRGGRRRRRPASTARSSRWSTTRTSRCCCSRCSGRCRSPDGRRIRVLAAGAGRRCRGRRGAITASGDPVDRTADAVELEAEQPDDDRNGRADPHGAGVDVGPHDRRLDRLQARAARAARRAPSTSRRGRTPAAAPGCRRRGRR